MSSLGTALALALGAACATTPVVAAPADKPLQGHYEFRGATAVDPPAGEPVDTHWVVSLTGSAARDLYLRMNASPRRDACQDDGSLTKTIGGMQCTERVRPRRYECGFAIVLAQQRIEPAGAC